MEYINSHIKVKIICSKHGIFEQTPYKHMIGRGCQQCAKTTKHTKDVFTQKANNTHNNFYGYDKVSYINSGKKVIITCPIHGDFLQTPNNHLQGVKCPGCSNVASQTTQSFIKRSEYLHNFIYDYSKVKYITAKSHVIIICKDHGEFLQAPDHHLHGQGCPKCSDRVSKQEIEFSDFIKSAYNGKVITNTRSIIKPYELDVYLPDINKAFEYNGTYWHQEGVTRPIGYHQMKTDMCSDKGIKLMYVWEEDWTNNKRFIKECIRRNISERTD